MTPEVQNQRRVSLQTPLLTSKAFLTEGEIKKLKDLRRAMTNDGVQLVMAIDGICPASPGAGDSAVVCQASVRTSRNADLSPGSRAGIHTVGSYLLIALLA